jgi:hypothetical protein
MVLPNFWNPLLSLIPFLEGRSSIMLLIIMLNVLVDLKNIKAILVFVGSKWAVELLIMALF